MNRGSPRRMFLITVSLLVMGGWLIAACDGNAAAPTMTSNWPTSAPSLAASVTVNPLPPIAEGEDIHGSESQSGVTNPTMAALPAEGQLDEDLATFTPRPTEASLPMQITTSDGLVLRGTLYSAPVRPAPGILMLHMENRDRSSWDLLAQRLQALGYEVLTVDLRGHGDTGGKTDWTLAQNDVRAALALLTELPGVNPTRIVIIGASVGANLGVNACADLSSCVGVVMLSPGLDYHGITAADAMARLGPRPILIAASENDRNNPTDSITLDGLATGEHQRVIYPAAGHGTDMLTNEPGLIDLIAGWVQAHNPSIVPLSTPNP